AVSISSAADLRGEVVADQTRDDVEHHHDDDQGQCGRPGTVDVGGHGAGVDLLVDRVGDRVVHAGRVAVEVLLVDERRQGRHAAVDHVPVDRGHHADGQQQRCGLADHAG